VKKFSIFFIKFVSIVVISIILSLPFIAPVFLIKGFNIITVYLLAFILFFIIGFLYYFPVKICLKKNLKRKKGFLISVSIILITGLTAYGITNLCGTLMLKKAIEVAKKEGIRFEFKDIVPAEIPDEKNAAVVFQEVFTMLKRMGKEQKNLINESYGIVFSKFEHTPESPEKKVNQARKLLFGDEFNKFFNLIDKAVSMPDCRFKINYEDGPGALSPHLSKLREIARIYALKSYFLAEKQDVNSALKTIETIFSLGDCLLNEPFIISQLVRFSLYEVAVDSFQEIFYTAGEKLSSKDLEKMIFLIDNKKLDITDPYVKDYILMIGWVFGNILPGPFKKGDIPIMCSLCVQITDTPYNKLYKTVFLPVLKMDAALTLKIIIRAKYLVSLPFYSVSSDLKKLEQYIHDCAERYHSGAMLTGFSVEIPVIRSQYLARLSAMKILCGLEIYKRKYGDYPERLEQLIPEIFQQLPLDPFTGKNFIYRKHGGKIIIYSVGRNLKDDGGTYDLKKEKDDIVWKNKKD